MTTRGLPERSLLFLTVFVTTILGNEGKQAPSSDLHDVAAHPESYEF